MSNRELQLVELEALESVLRDGKLMKISDWMDEMKEIEGIVEIDFDSIADPKVLLEGTSSNGVPFSEQLPILPPIRMKFKLPSGYPSGGDSPFLELKSFWMSSDQIHMCDVELKRICVEEDVMTMGVLYLCYQRVIDMIDKILPTRIINLNNAFALKKDGETIESLRKKLLGKGQKAVEEHFANTVFDCEVCYDTLMGFECIQFRPCGHVFCKTCTFDFHRSLARGVVSKTMQCLADGCKSEASQKTVQEALGEQLYAKYEEIMLEKAIREMADSVECPRENCGKVAYVTDRPRHLGECSYCGFSFCLLCKETFHGVNRCKLRKEDEVKIVKLWLEGDPSVRSELSLKYGGEKAVTSLVERFLNAEWICENSKPCPSCSVNIEKETGCHHMHCVRCDTHFCWLCNSVLNKNTPYEHYNGKSTCAGRLYERVFDDIF